MASQRRRARRTAKPSPEQQTAELSRELQDWPGFVEGIIRSRDQLAAWRAAGNTGWPPGWVSFRDFLREHPL